MGVAPGSTCPTPALVLCSKGQRRKQEEPTLRAGVTKAIHAAVVHCGLPSSDLGFSRKNGRKCIYYEELGWEVSRRITVRM